MPIGHNLCHRQGDTSHIGMAVLAAVDVGQQHVVRQSLAPMHVEHRGNGGAAGSPHLGCRTGDNRFDLCSISVQPFLHGWGHVVGIKAAAVAVCQHCGQAVIASDNDKALVGDC